MIYIPEIQQHLLNRKVYFLCTQNLFSTILMFSTPPPLPQFKWNKNWATTSKAGRVFQFQVSFWEKWARIMLKLRISPKFQVNNQKLYTFQVVQLFNINPFSFHQVEQSEKNESILDLDSFGFHWPLFGRKKWKKNIVLYYTCIYILRADGVYRFWEWKTTANRISSMNLYFIWMEHLTMAHEK